MKKKYISKHKQRKIARRKTGGLITVFVLSLLAIIVLLLPQFYVRDINITGLRMIQREDVIKEGEFQTGVHLFKGIGGSFSDILGLRHKGREDILYEKFPFIRSVTVKSTFPYEIAVDINERVEIAYVAVRDGFVMIDSSGVAVRALTGDFELNIPLIEGIQTTKVNLGENISVDIPEYLNQSIILLNDIINADKDDRIDVQLLARIDSIRVVQDKIAYLKVDLPETNEQIMVRVKIDSRLPGEMSWLRFAIYQGSLSDRGKGIFDLTTTQRTFQPSND